MERWASPLLRAQAAYLRHLGTSPVAEVMERDGIFGVRTGIDSNAESGVISSGSVPVSAADAAAMLAWMGERRLPACWLCSEGHALSDTAHVLGNAGCRPENAAWSMQGAIEPVVSDVRAPTAVSVRAVASAKDLDAWIEVASACGWIESDDDRRARRDLVLSFGFAEATPKRLYVASRGDRPVGMAAAFYTCETVMLTAVAVLEEERRRGVGRALAMMRLEEAQMRGCTSAVLGPSPDGVKLYQALGFTVRREPEGRCFYLPVHESDASHG